MNGNARKDLQRIHRYISKQLKEPEIARKLIKQIANELEILGKIPKGFSIVNFYNKKRYEYRKLVIKIL